MTQKTLGYVELEWECPNCHSRNPGAARTCTQCGAPHPEDVDFQQAPQETIITDQAKIAEAEAGADIYCAYCGAPNPATRKTCRQCGSDLAEGKARASGKVLGALRTGEAAPLVCPSCGASNPATALKCAKCGATLTQPKPPAPQPVAAPPAGCGRMLPLIIAGIVAIVILAIIFIVMGSRKTDVIGQVQGVNWRRAIAVEALMPVVREAWRDEIPAGVEVGTCRKQPYKIQDSPAPGAEEICGTPYVFDKGSGFGQVVQDCKYQVYADRCQYRTMVWQAVAPLVLEGSDFGPRWPPLSLTQGQREAGRTEAYTVIFNANDKSYAYRPGNQQEFGQYSVGSQWRLKVNSFGDVSVEGPR